jgi:hypothetical protein
VPAFWLKNLASLLIGWRAHHEASAQTEEAQPPEAGDTCQEAEAKLSDKAATVGGL